MYGSNLIHVSWIPSKELIIFFCLYSTLGLEFRSGVLLSTNLRVMMFVGRSVATVYKEWCKLSRHFVS